MKVGVAERGQKDTIKTEKLTREQSALTERAGEQEHAGGRKKGTCKVMRASEDATVTNASFQICYTELLERLSRKLRAMLPEIHRPSLVPGIRAVLRP